MRKITNEQFHNLLIGIDELQFLAIHVHDIERAQTALGAINETIDDINFANSDNGFPPDDINDLPETKSGRTIPILYATIFLATILAVLGSIFRII